MLRFWLDMIWPSFWASLMDIGQSYAGLIYWALAFLFPIIWKTRQGLAAIRKHLVQLCRIGTIYAILAWTPIFFYELGNSAYIKYKNAEMSFSKAQNKMNDLAKDKAVLQAELSDKKHLLQVLDVFRIYRSSIGSDRDCRVLITGAKDSNRMISVFIPAVVSGSNCPNGNLLNIGIRPENEEEESMKGSVPGYIVVHMLPDAPGANQLVDNLSNIVPVKRSYRLPMPTQGHIVWLQIGKETKWNDEQFP